MDDSISSKLRELFDLYKSGALNKDEYDLLKSEIIEKKQIVLDSSKKQDILDKKNPDLQIEKEEEPSDYKKAVLENQELQKTTRYGFMRTPEFASRVIVTLSLLIIILVGFYSGVINNSFLVALIGILVLVIFYFALLKILLLKLNKLTSSLILLSFPFLVIVLFNSSINVFSKYTYDKNILKVVNYQYDENGKQIPYEIFMVRKDTFDIYDGDTAYIKTGMYKRFNEEGKIVVQGVIEDGLMRGDWLLDDWDFNIKIHFDNVVNYELLEKIGEKYQEEKYLFESYADDIATDNEGIVTNGFISPFDMAFEDVNGGLPDGELIIYYDDNIYVKGQTKAGYLDGEFKFYNPEGKVYKEVDYNKGIPMNVVVFEENIRTEQVSEPNGKNKILTSKLFNGNYHGSYIKFDSYGEKIFEGNYIDGNLHGEARNYSRFTGNYRHSTSYELTKITTYYNGHKHGLLTSYWSEQGKYHDDFGNNVNYTQIYRHGKKHGTFTKYSSGPTRRTSGIWYTEEYINGEEVE